MLAIGNVLPMCAHRHGEGAKFVGSQADGMAAYPPCICVGNIGRVKAKEPALAALMQDVLL